MIVPKQRCCRFLALSFLLWGIGGCDLLDPDDGAPRGPGTIHAGLLGPYSQEGAAVIELTGGSGLGEVTVEGGEVYYQHREGTTRIVIILDEPGPILFRVRSQDVGVLPTATVVQLADGENQLRSDLSSVSLDLEPVADPTDGDGGG